MLFGEWLDEVGHERRCRQLTNDPENKFRVTMFDVSRGVTILHRPNLGRQCSLLARSLVFWLLDVMSDSVASEWFVGVPRNDM